MNCIEAQKHFADLLDHSRDERLRKINDHLTACSRCTEELADLARCQRIVSALPPVEPPAGFTTRIMAEIPYTTDRPNRWQRLFLPLQIKLPLQAAAVILISVLTVFIYHKQSGQRQLTTTDPPPIGLQQHDTEKLAPAASRAPAAESKTEKAGAAGAQKTQLNPSIQSEQPRSAAKPAEQSNVLSGVEADTRKSVPPPTSGDPAKSAPSKPKEESSPADEADSVRQEQSLRAAEAQAKGVPSSAPLRDSPSAGLEEKRAASSLDALSSRITVSSDRELILRLKRPVRDDSNIEAPLELEQSQAGPSSSQAQFKELDQGRRRAIETGQPQTVWVTIRASRYEGFKKELAGLSNIESELPAPAQKNEVKPADQLRIKLTILPSLSSTDSPSPR